MTGHHDQEFGDRAIRGPQLVAVEDVVRAVFAQFGRGAQTRRVGPDVLLRQGEGGNGPGGQTRKIGALLLLRPEHLQRLGNPDGLVRGYHHCG